MKNYNRLKNRFISIILTLISIVSIDTICVFAGGNSDIKTSKYQIKKKAPDTEVSAWDKFLNYLKDLNLGDQNSIISFLTGGGLVSIPWLIGLLISRNKQKNMIRDFISLEEKTKHYISVYSEREQKTIDDKKKIEKDLNDANRKLRQYELEKKVETEDIIILKAWNRILNHRKLKTNENPEEFCTEEITITTDIQKNIDIIQENIQKKFYNLLPIIHLAPDGRYSFYFSPRDIENWKNKVTIKKYKDFEPGEKSSINKIFNYICAGLSGMNFESNENLDTIVSRYKIDKSGLGAWTEDNRLLCYLCERLKGQKGLETFEKFVK